MFSLGKQPGILVRGKLAGLRNMAVMRHINVIDLLTTRLHTMHDAYWTIQD
jgi:hypothetical protein